MTDGIREIEVKYRVTEPAALIRALAVRGVDLSAASHQDDQAYAANGWSYGQSKQGRAFARLRTQNGRHLFCVKTPLDNELACQEHETEVLGRREMHAAILAMGFYPTVRIVKTRRTARLDDMVLCLDEVDGLGAFFEIEVMDSSGQPARQVQAELDRFARSLGVELERSTESYDSLIRSASAVAV
ncbi:CYTH domain-containing protein [Micromonospora sp. WMMD1128]|uniref:class IV adenylate cyclase n=1 Tax=unclassified Micromonospora TaxID=2617518 RepID=UPI00248C770C|nr:MULTISPECIES: CYTH domain-containing protein [unclassified Micromonospora]WBB72618.1 CYTH domain-containing protein [Micromonospora sp. WMMD1128]WFE33939.1 CYTH domain-containing protein [Micromonospora sp. WMMD975]